MSDWWRGAIVYQIYPRSFQDSNGDGIGDLNGITRRLDHVASLGADAIWLSPIFTSPMKDMGYDVSDYTDIDPLFGTLAEFDALLARAHDLGLKVIIDQVISHSSDKHPWFVESRTSRDNPKADWYVWADPNPDGTPPNNWPSVFGGPAWEWEPRRRQYYLHNFLIEQPDLNMHNPEVQDALLETMRFWLARGVDGFRLDTVNYYFHDQDLRSNPPNPDGSQEMATDTYGMQDHIYSKNRPENLAFLERLRALTDEFDDRMMVGEVGDGGQRAIDLMAAYTKGTKRLHMCYSFEMLGPDFSAGHFRRVIEGFLNGAPDGWPSWSFSNHDVPRHVTRWATHAEDQDALAKQTVALLMSFEGTIGIYQGEELGLPETEMEYHELTDPPGLRFWPEQKGRDGCRTPMVWQNDAPHAGFTTGTPWLPVKVPQIARAVDLQDGETGSVLAAYRAMIGFRKSRPSLVEGRTEFIDCKPPLLAFQRIADGDALTCVFNLGTSPTSVSVTSDARLAHNQFASVRNGQLKLGPNGFAFLEHDDASSPVKLKL
ncbi:alpha-amylase family glycosyl hydrolase [Poseidonocella sedimentorum]|uniref:Alpha-glucosidase n=1 Tax=Poseidonocella sedimentorum TaxID=871652 RepID=A0A1I6D868_9RHOB|nr:alpha-amylase family glycosyl hydrolase [Poseidonocella sedimentorum]SFR01666.1 alpha-glucosidase [Poseidonocella sedimentorum]